MKIALIGYGKMGKAIEEIALERGHSVALKISSDNISDLTTSNLQKADVAIEFSRPESAAKNIILCAQAQIPVVVGTTAWYEEYDAIVDEVKKQNGALLAATNFSIGVNLFFELNARLAQMMNSHTNYEASIKEVHHTQKLDSPSGTAITIAEGIIQNHQSYHQWEEQDASDEGTLKITADRIQDVPGTHVVNYESEVDTISIEHKAHNRKGFALGAVVAAEFLQHKIGIFSMKDVIKL